MMLVLSVVQFLRLSTVECVNTVPFYMFTDSLCSGCKVSHVPPMLIYRCHSSVTYHPQGSSWLS